MTKAYVRVMVDWDNNGNFTGTYDDITDDTRSMSFTHTRQESTDYMNGSVLNVQLNNNDNLYSPPKESGALYGNLTSGKPMVCRMWYPYDNFTDSTGTNLTSHAVPYDADFTWTVPTGAFKCHADGYAELTTGATSYGVLDLTLYDVELSAEITTSAGTTANHDAGIICRYVDTSNYLFVRTALASNQIELRKVVAGVDSSVGFASYTWGASTKRTLMVRCHGDRISVFVDDVKVLRLATGSTSLAMEKATSHGIIAFSSATDVKFHDFGGFRPLFKGTLKEIRPRPSSGMQYCYLKGYDLFEDLKLSQNFGFINDQEEIKLAGASGTPFRSIMMSTGLQSGTADADQTRTIEDDAADYYQCTGEDGAYAATGVITLNGLTFLETMFILQDSEDGFIYGDGHGMIHFESHNHRESDTHQDTACIYNDEYDGTNPAYTGFAYDDGVDGVYNIAQFGYKRALSTASYTNTLTSGTASYVDESAIAGGIPISAGETIDIIAKAQDRTANDEVYAHRIAGSTNTVTSPTSSDLIQVNTAADGSGSLLNWSSTYTSTTVYGGQYAKATITNTSASQGYIKKLQFNLLATLNTVNKGITQVENSDSITTFGERRLTREKTFFDGLGLATIPAAHRIARVKDPIVRMRLDLINHDKATLLNIVHRRLSDRVHVIESGMGLSFSAYVDGFTYRFSQGNTVINQTIHVTQSGVGAAAGRWGYMRWGMNKWS